MKTLRKPMSRRWCTTSLILFAALSAQTAAADEPPFEVRIAIRNHKFEPAVIEVPANRTLKMIVTNEDPTAEEFESVSLKIERIIPGGRTAEFTVRGLRPNRNYKFFGDFHQSTAQGQIIVKDVVTQ